MHRRFDHIDVINIDVMTISTFWPYRRYQHRRFDHIDVINIDVLTVTFWISTFWISTLWSCVPENIGRRVEVMWIIPIFLVTNESKSAKVCLTYWTSTCSQILSPHYRLQMSMCRLLPQLHTAGWLDCQVLDWNKIVFIYTTPSDF